MRETADDAWTPFTVGLPQWTAATRLRGRHALVRTVDRVEAAVLVLVCAIAVIALPVAGAIGTELYDSMSHSHAGAQAATGGVVIWAGTTLAAVTVFLVARALCNRVREARWDSGLRNLADSEDGSAHNQNGQ
ncbi:hypothetical protein [Mycolicibacterium gilvum]|uniref:Transmembrane protein n=1 Tax=Mycolicibacterium gilvum (strain DSM 45189 / LMG 24558 / Spyr1) TaxID=278137 RepID=E6TPJ1_MYCSR|nr:hypothetical protein [Mycolicibacterium gilvum]ADU01741.1 hypothetical protein Mspyr1_52140 [Mycolicibacterium gilvum Spyr1]